MKILELYKHLLSCAALTADEDGMISSSMAGATAPFTIEGKRLVMPTKAQMSNPDREHRIVFHPLSENTWRNESLVMSRFRNAMNLRLNYVLGGLAEELLTLIASQKMHAKLSPEQSEILTSVKGADEKTLEAFKALRKAMGLGNKDKCIIHMFLKKQAKIGNKVHSRGVITSSPLYDELCSDAKTVFGVKLSAKDKKCIKELLEYLIPGIDKPHHFDKGSDSDIAPFLDALMKGLLGIAANVNALTEEFEKFLTYPDEYRYNDEWVEVFENLDQMLPEIRMIPMQAGNEGGVEAKAGAAPAPVQAQSPFQPVAPCQPFAPVQPGYGALQPAAPGPVKNSSGMIDFEASMRNNPQLAQQLHVNVQYGVPQPMLSPQQAARNAPPRWDQPAPVQSYPQTGWVQQAPMQGYPPVAHPQPGGFQRGGLGGI